MTSVSADDLYELSQNSKGVVIIDVRTPQEFERGAVSGSINIPLDTIQRSLVEKFPQKDIPLYLYCLSGSRSCVAAEKIEALGYTNVHDVQNGLLAWRMKGYPLG